MKINMIGIDLAKDIFQVFGIDSEGTCLLDQCIKTMYESGHRLT